MTIATLQRKDCGDDRISATKGSFLYPQPSGRVIRVRKLG